MKNKRGSHVDVILSFIIFISFVVFIYAILQPTLTTREVKSSLANSLETALVENMSGANLSIVSFSINQGASASCIDLSDFLDNANIANPTIMVRNLTGNIFPSFYSSPSRDLYIDTSQDPESNYIFQVYYSSEFNIIPTSNLGGSCNSLTINNPSSGYTIGQTENFTSPYVFDFKVIQLINNYKNDYSSVKKWFNLSAADNFGFNFTYQNQTSIGTGETMPILTNIFSEPFSILYVNGTENGVESGLLSVRVW